MKTLKEYGRDSPYFQGMLSSSLVGQVVVPFNLKQLFRCLSNKTEYKLWLATWKDLLGRTLPSLLRDPITSTDNGGDPITLNHLMGEGDWKSTSDQAENIQESVLEVIKEKAQLAFCDMWPAGPLTPYSEIFQGPTEPFVGFVKRLTTAVEQQVPRVHAREEVLEEMVSTHANEVCKEIILRIPKQPGEYPTLNEMLWAVSAMTAAPRLRPQTGKRTGGPKVAVVQSGEDTLLPDLTTDSTQIDTPDLPPQDVTPRDLILPEPEGSLTTTSRYEPFRLQLAEPLHLRDRDWHTAMVSREKVAIEERPTLKLNWLSDVPVWVEQWPLSKQKLKALNELVEEQLQKGHIVESTSPWNSPVFVIQKSDKTRWRLLHDLRKINEVIEDMGSLQPGMPSPTMLPQNWNLAVIDIKDCFFQIPLHPDDAPHFAFSVPTINREAPRKRYHWRVLPQGMKNSLVICQWYVSSLLAPVRAAAHQAIIHHYMDDVLVCAPTGDLLAHALDLTVASLVAAGFELQDSKIQKMPPWKYLGLEIGRWTIVPQQLAIKTKIKNLADVQQLYGTLNWVRPWLSLSTEDLAPLFSLLKGGEEGLSSPRSLTPEAKQALEKVQETMSTRLNSGQISKAMLEHLLQENESLQFALDNYSGQISIFRPAHKIFNSDSPFQLELKSVQSKEPLDALTVFTDASGRSHKSVMTWRDPKTQQWKSDVAEVEGSPQVAELAAVVRAFERFPEPFNLITDSAYVAGVVSRAENSILQEVDNIALFEFLLKLVKLISRRKQPFYVMHVRSHTDLPGIIAEGNRRADALTAPVEIAPLPNIFEQAKLSHQLHHQNAPGLVWEFNLTRDQAKAIVAACPTCQQHSVPPMPTGVNPRGLSSCEVWQTDVTHFAPFGRQKYVHVSVDTFSGAVFASAHTGEKSADAIRHLVLAFSFLGIPKSLKTDNGPAYTSREFCSFLQQWGIGHKTGIPYSPTGQAIVERTHQNIKRVLSQQDPVLKNEPPSIRLACALFTLNFLNCSFEAMNPPVTRHFRGSARFLSGSQMDQAKRDAAKRASRGILIIQGMLLASLLGPTWAWIVPQPKVNVWKTLAKTLGQDHICLSSAAAGDPLSSCLVGIPFAEKDFPPALLHMRQSFNHKPIKISHFTEINHASTFIKNPLALWKEWNSHLPELPQEPQELDLLGSSPSPFCIHFTYNPPESQRKLYHTIKQIKDAYWASSWCSALAHVAAPSTAGSKSLSLPTGTFLICGDRAYAGIPARTIGGPCTLGKLGLFTPNKTQIVDWIRKNSSRRAPVQKRDLASLDPDCNSEIVHWSRAKATAVMVFLPWISIAKAMGELGRLECWVVKQANLTTNALTDLLSDEQITRQATLQNRAAIDYLLLLHEHSCEEFEGMCCFNLSSKAENVRQSIAQIREMINNIKKETRGWLDNLFEGWGLSSWSGSIVKTVLLIVFILFMISVAFALIKKLLSKLLSDTTSPSINRVSLEDLELQKLEEALRELDSVRAAPSAGEAVNIQKQS
ncbi:hypothetical protein HGM15179_016198 [Zosterops borbonicus]|uniref:Uncharacterized protein n=1 Tax=Zosterops borbonicus TaxID=364589 RepID=A0A8K1LEI7_9PASS|nr:hypothetical protein HGM15179_016198 [Zosterops borbonicus]